MTDHHETVQDTTLLDDEARRSRLAHHLGKLVHAGAELEMQHGLRAIVVRTQKVQYLPNVFLSGAGVAGFYFLHEPLFLAGAAVALVGWHKKLVTGAQKIRSVIRVDERGQISEKVIEAA